MNEQVWYLYQNDQQLGPFSTEQLIQLNDNKMISKEAFLFKVGWKDWRSVTDTWHELGLSGNMPTADSNFPARRGFAPRISVEGRVIVHNDGQMTIAKGVNISVSGVFIETEEQLFTIGETLKITIKFADLTKSYNCKAQVIRYNSNAKWPVGYGLMFEEKNEDLVTDIRKLVTQTAPETGQQVVNQG